MQSKLSFSGLDLQEISLIQCSNKPAKTKKEFVPFIGKRKTKLFKCIYIANTGTNIGTPKGEINKQ